MKIVKPKTDLFGFTSNRIEDNTDCKEFVLEVLQKADFNISSIEIEEEEISIDEELKTLLIKVFVPIVTQLIFSLIVEKILLVEWHRLFVVNKFEFVPDQILRLK